MTLRIREMAVNIILFDKGSNGRSTRKKAVVRLIFYYKGQLQTSRNAVVLYIKTRGLNNFISNSIVPNLIGFRRRNISLSITNQPDSGLRPCFQ